MAKAAWRVAWEGGLGTTLRLWVLLLLVAVQGLGGGEDERKLGWGPPGVMQRSFCTSDCMVEIA